MFFVSIVSVAKKLVEFILSVQSMFMCIFVVVLGWLVWEFCKIIMIFLLKIENLLGLSDNGLYWNRIIIDLVRNGDIDMVKLIEKHRNCLVAYAFDHACKDDEPEWVINRLLNTGLIGPGVEDDVSLLIAVKNNRLDVVKNLIHRGIELDWVEPLVEAVDKDYMNIAKLLLESKMDVSGNAYCLRTAVDNENVEMVKLLLEHKATADYYTLETIADSGRVDIMRLLIEHKIDVVDDPYVLPHASERGNVEMVKLLIDEKADIGVAENYSVWIASENGHREVVSILLKNGADFSKLTPKDKEYFKMKKAYSRWRQVYLRKWFRRVITPLMYSPYFPVGIKAKKELENI